jgi:hypothetical protein
MKSFKSGAVTALLAIVFLGGTLTIAVSRYSAQTWSPLPRGNWSFSLHPYQGADLQDRPVIITSVEASGDKGALTRVVIRNRSSQAVTAVKLKWSLSYKQDRDAALSEGTTDWMELPRNIPAGKFVRMKFSNPFVSFITASNRLQRNGFLNGDFCIIVSVSEARYEDGSYWIARRRIGNAYFLNASYKAPTSQEGCAKQACEVIGGGSGYKCGDSKHSEYCTNYQTSCCNALCGSPPCRGQGN